MTVLWLISFMVIPIKDVFAADTVYSGLMLPFPSGYILKAANTHGNGRNAIDFGLAPSYGEFPVLAMKGGIIQLSKDPNNGVLYVDHQDGYCSVYMHLKVGTFPPNGTKVLVLTQIATAGKTQADVIHLHALVISKRGGSSCPGFDPKIDEVRMNFNQYGEIPRAGVMNSGISVSNQSSAPGLIVLPGTGSPQPQPTPPPTVFGKGLYSTLWQDQNWGRANLKVCADNLPGQMVYVRFWRAGREFSNPPQRATSNCVIFWDMDAAGPMNRSTTYYSQAALNQNPNPSWPIPCAGPTGGQGLCDSIRRP